MAHAENLDQGKLGPQPAVFRGPGGKTWMHTFRKARKYPILPINGLTTAENRAIENELKDATERAMRTGG